MLVLIAGHLVLQKVLQVKKLAGQAYHWMILN
jgi:hypothetical protein